MELDSLDQLIMSRMYGTPDIAEIVVMVGLARTTVLKHLNRLVKDGLIAREKMHPKGMGRPRFTYKVKSMSLQTSVTVEVVSLTFQKLKHACRFEKGGWCREVRKTCSQENCHLIIRK